MFRYAPASQLSLGQVRVFGMLISQVCFARLNGSSVPFTFDTNLKVLTVQATAPINQAFSIQFGC